MQSFLSLGRLHIPIYGLYGAVGVMCAMALGLRTSKLARVDRDGFWDAGAFAVLAAFVISRAMLVAENVRMFLQHPLLVLELPALTMGGKVTTALVTLVYLRRKRLPLLNVLDAAAPCGVLLWAFLNLGLYGEGTREGMPTSFLLAVPSSFGRVHPVEIYLALGAFLLCGVLLWVLGRQRAAGTTGALAMVLGGLLQFVMCFFRLPQVLYSNSLMDGSQWRALELMVVGTLLLAWRVGFGAGPVMSANGVSDAV